MVVGKAAAAPVIYCIISHVNEKGVGRIVIFVLSKKNKKVNLVIFLYDFCKNDP